MRKSEFIKQCDRRTVEDEHAFKQIMDMETINQKKKREGRRHSGTETRLEPGGIIEEDTHDRRR